MKLNQLINEVQNSPASIFTKEDVVALFKKLECAPISTDELGDVSALIIKNVSKQLYSLVNIDNLVVNISNNHNADVYDICFSIDEDELNDIILDAFSATIPIMEMEEFTTTQFSNTEASTNE